MREKDKYREREVSEILAKPEKSLEAMFRFSIVGGCALIHRRIKKMLVFLQPVPQMIRRFSVVTL